MIYRRIALPGIFGLSARLYIPELGEEAPCPDSGALSYDSDGAMLLWERGCDQPFSCFACNMEILLHDNVRMEVFRRDFGDPDDDDAFVRRWVVSEVMAKLHNTPIVPWIKLFGLAPYLWVDRAHDLDDARLFLTQRYGRALAFGFLR